MAKRATRQATREEFAEATYRQAAEKRPEWATRYAQNARMLGHRYGEDAWIGSGVPMTDLEIFEILGIEDAIEEVAEETTETAEATETETTTTENEEETEMANTTNTTETRRNGLKMNLQFFAANASTSPRANRVVVRATEDGGFEAEFFKTHKHIAVVASKDTDWHRNKEHNPTQAREDFRTWIQSNASQFGINWMPELQQQAWDRKYWKYETDEQVEEDAIELMGWTIKTICEKVGLKVELGKMALDSIVPMDSPLTYVENGKYTKNGNWAVAQVNLEVRATIEDKEIDIIYPIEMRSGQLTKIKLTKEEIKAMVADSEVA